ncbi:rhamnulokinase [Kribbella orskensis]|uniref:Rhamnulokinase n=1 Tax=Kribbella orskensis TaxID=2512216 RepID=A0ABY2BPW1_9ACTN|nr:MULTISPECIES: rhamnulokinase family protein [Kribbella]TCN39889.1 rhamnulokinase [Kribbella sp. VKM Ac-2500]TCO27328.1 rhamnulokinase [Kribbella orskensis]
MTLRLAAVDLGASSGRVMLGRVGPDELELTEVHRFWNGPVRLGETLHWDVLHLYREMLVGLRNGGSVEGVGIDSWAVDYGLLDGSGTLLGNPVHYRDARTNGVMERVLQTVPADELYAVTGLQQLPFNTIYQLVAEGNLDRAETLLMIPDLLAYWLTGKLGGEATNASTTQLYDVRAHGWSETLAARAGVPVRLLPELREAGDVIGPLLPAVAEEAGLDPATPVIAVGSHDTASSVVAVPAAEGERFAYISSGTWSLAGLELDVPILSDEAQRANFTNEGGVDGRIRFLKNVMGLWILQECLRVWGTDDLPGLLSEAAAAPAYAVLIDPDDPSFLAPGNMPARIAEFCAKSGQEPPRSKAAAVRCILESLALAYRRTLRLAQTVADREIDVVRVIGGGSRNELLCQLTADACGLPVLAGPVEASALGNVLVQARALGAPLPDLTAMRALVRATHELRRYEPQGKPADWDAAESRVFGGSG